MGIIELSPTTTVPYLLFPGRQTGDKTPANLTQI